MPLLTKRQKEILDYIRDFLDANHYAPSLMEIAHHLGLTSPATIHQHLKGLVEKGLIERGWNKKRFVALVERNDTSAGETIDVPLLGLIAAGKPIEAVLDSQAVAVPSSMLRGARVFALRVSGNSMIEDHIVDGDIVLVEAANSVESGQTVVALLEDNNATLKKYFREGDTVRLQPANEAMPPIIVGLDEVRIQGVAIGLLRRFYG